VTRKERLAFKSSFHLFSCRVVGMDRSHTEIRVSGSGTHNRTILLSFILHVFNVLLIN